MSDIIAERLAQVGPLQTGAHPDHDAMCVNEAVAYVAGESWTDTPKCACPVISAVMASLNDALPDDERDPVLRPMIPRLIGTRATPQVAHRRSMMAVDWLVREYTPAWLRLANLTQHATALSSLPEITDFAQCPVLVLEAARKDLGAVRDDAFWAAALAAPGFAAWAAVGAAPGLAARDTSWATARDTSWAAVRAAAWAAAGDVLNKTRIELQQSALAMVERMIAVNAEDLQMADHVSEEPPAGSPSRRRRMTVQS